MNLKNIFDNKTAVSPVIGVVLMVAITVILAAAIGSSVFGESTSEPAPQANLNIKANTPWVDASTPATVKIEHLGGDPINFESNSTTKIMATVNSNSYEIAAYDGSNGDYCSELGIMSVGDTSLLNLTHVNDTCAKVVGGTNVNFKIIDVATNQLIVDKDVRF